MKMEIRKVGDDIVIVLPTDTASQLGWEPGDVCEGEVCAAELRIVRTETKEHARAMKIARRGMEKYRNTLEKLAKS
jgi:bifunctional DNA-binding transcriptional regulator/antitoxin component of YhaV-PrlF toxin-antitoxin module